MRFAFDTSSGSYERELCVFHQLYIFRAIFSKHSGCVCTQQSTKQAAGVLSIQIIKDSRCLGSPRITNTHLMEVHKREGESGVLSCRNIRLLLADSACSLHLRAHVLVLLLFLSAYYAIVNMF